MVGPSGKRGHPDFVWPALPLEEVHHPLLLVVVVWSTSALNARTGLFAENTVLTRDVPSRSW
jgi:hypothetical protein